MDYKDMMDAVAYTTMLAKNNYNIATFDETIGLFDHLDRKQDNTSYRELPVIYGRKNGKSMQQLQWLIDRLAENDEQSKVRYHKMFNRLQITNVIYNNPATIVFWSDGQKTVVKCGENDTFDPEKGLAMAISKRFFGNHGNYYNEIKKWLPVEEEEKNEHSTLEESLAKIAKAATTFKMCFPHSFF